jgi:hypothetical protein
LDEEENVPAARLFGSRSDSVQICRRCHWLLVARQDDVTAFQALGACVTRGVNGTDYDAAWHRIEPQRAGNLRREGFDSETE